MRKKDWIIKQKSELNQPVYFEDVLNSQWKPGDMLCCGRGFSLIPTGEMKTMDTIKISKYSLCNREIS